MATRNNELNDLTGREWIRFTRTWFVCDSPRYWRNRDTELHPARFPEEMVAQFLRFFTKSGGAVLDPFAGSGATLVACEEQGRVGVGVELAAKYARTAERRTRTLLTPQFVLQGDARQMGRAAFWGGRRRELEEAGIAFRRALPQFDFVITSPPYWRMLHTSRGGVLSKHKQRALQGLDLAYSDSPEDLGNVEDYGQFVAALARTFHTTARLVKEGKYLVVVAQNLRDPAGEIQTLPWDLVKRMHAAWQFQGERIWCQNTKPLGIWGYPKIFVPNYHHHYCLIFRKRQTAKRG